MIKVNKYGQSDDVETGRAISIQQPFVEQILTGKKKTEYRSSGNVIGIRGRVYLYASKTLRSDEDYQEAGYERGKLQTGLIVGSVEIVGCFVDDGGTTNIQLKNPIRYKEPLVPENGGQPLFFYPFGPSRSPRNGPKIILTSNNKVEKVEVPVKKKQPKKPVGPVLPSPELAAMIGDKKISRATMLAKLYMCCFFLSETFFTDLV